MSRQVVASGQQHRFFINIIPGMESVTYLELAKRWSRAPESLPLPAATFFKGGVEIETERRWGAELNHWLRTANRILLRWRDFPAPHIKAFKIEIERLPWAEFFSPGSEIDIQFTSRSSKLSHKKQILEVMASHLKSRGLKLDSGGFKVYLRFFRDHCQVSIDTTGERGQFRGQDKKVGRASLRDNSAAALLGVLTQGLDLEEYTLIDPMAGSGTFLLEGLQLADPLEREFAFHHLRPWQDRIPQQGEHHRTFKKAIGYEKDSATAELAKGNLGRAGCEHWQIVNADAFKAQVEPEDKSLLIVNPPWGKRLQTQLGDQWLADLLNLWRPQRAGVLWSSQPLPTHKGYVVARHLWLENSGLKNQFVLLIPEASASFAT